MSTKKTILILDAFCSAHIGNDVLLDSSIKVINKAWPEADVRIHALVPESFELTLGLKCRPALFSDLPNDGTRLQKGLWAFGTFLFMLIQIINAYTIRLPPNWLTTSRLRRQALKDIHNADIAVSIGGEMINDDFRKTLPFYLFLFVLPTRWKAHTIIFPQSIGPLRRRWTRTITRWALTRCTAVTARDMPSLEELKGLGFDGNQALFSPDVGIDQPMSSRDDAYAYLKQLDLPEDGERAWIGITPSNWTEEGVARGNYLETLAEAVSHLAQKRSIGVLVMPANLPLYGCRPMDRDTAIWLRNQLDGVCPVFVRNEALISARLFKGISSILHLYISTRMHAAILSTNALTPTITLNTQRKLHGYMSNIGQECYSIDIENMTAEGLEATMREMLDHNDEIRHQLKESHKMLSQQLSRYAHNLRTLIP